jgi:hypothetical protein
MAQKRPWKVLYQYTGKPRYTITRPDIESAVAELLMLRKLGARATLGHRVAGYPLTEYDDGQVIRLLHEHKVNAGVIARLIDSATESDESGITWEASSDGDMHAMVPTLTDDLLFDTYSFAWYRYNEFEERYTVYFDKSADAPTVPAEPLARQLIRERYLSTMPSEA